MKTLRKVLLGAAIGALMAPVTVPAGSDTATAWLYQPTLVGTWQFDMTVRFDAPDCTTSEEIPFGPNPFPGLISFHEGGTLNEYASRTPPTVRTTGFGSWKQAGRDRYRARHTFMEFDVNGALWRTMVVESKIQMAGKGNQYDAIGRLELTDISGNALNFCATIEAIRFKP